MTGFHALHSLKAHESTPFPVSSHLDLSSKMASETKRTRKRDRFKNLLSFGRRVTPQPAESSTNVTSTQSLTSNPTPLQQPSDAAPKVAVDAHIVPLPPLPLPVKAQKAFTKGQSFEKDIALLSASFILQETSELKELVLLIAVIHDNDEEDKLGDILEICAQFTVQLASAADADRAEATRAMTAFRKTVEKIRTSQLGSNATSLDLDDLKTIVNNETSNIKPSFLGNENDGTSQGLSKVLDVTIGTAISILSVINAASSLIPVPWVQPVVGQVIIMLQAVSQTRSNYNDMKEIAAIAGEFVISCAVICSENTAGPSTELKRALNKFTKKLRDIAEECNKLSQLDLFSRYFNQSAHTGDLQAIKTKLNNAIKLFQNDALVNIKLDTEALKRNIGNLPNHPYYTPNEYLEKSRDDVISYVSDWITNGPESVLWIHGAAGLGKSTVAQQLIQLLQSDDRLAGGVFLRYLTNEHPIKIIQIIAKLLGEKHPQAIPDIAEAARKLLSAHDLLSNYLAAYIINPVHALKYPYQLVVVIDGLDEWTNREPFLAELIHLPSTSPVKFVLTSRFNHSIERVLDKIVLRKYALPPASQTVIECYFNHHFESNDINWRGRKPDEDKIRRLSARADGSLIWAATVRSLVLNKFDKRYPHTILDQILSSEEKVATQHGGQLERLYRSALLNLCPPDIRGMLRDFLGAIIVLQEALSIADFAHLLGLPESAVEEIHRRLAILRTRGNIKSNVISPAIQTFHGSFLEFIQSISIESEEHSFQAVSATDTHFMLANRCIKIVFHEFLLSFRGQNCTYSELDGVELYATKFWPLHLSNGTERVVVSAESALENVSITGLQRWSTLFLPHVSSRFQNGHNTLDDIPKAGLPYKLAMIMGEGDPASLTYRIHCLELGVRLQTDDVKTWTALGDAYEELYEHSMYGKHLEDEIIAFRRALELISKEETEMEAPTRALIPDVGTVRNKRELAESSPMLNVQIGILDSLAGALADRFDHQGTVETLDEAIYLFREALALCPGLHPHHSLSLNNLANALWTRFQSQGALNDLDEAISLNQDALALRPAPHPGRSMSLNNLGNVLHSRYNQQGTLNDLDEAISLHREALSLRPVPHPDHSMSLNNLAYALHTRSEYKGTLNDLNEAILLHREALALCTTPNSNRSMSLSNLGDALHTRYNQQGALNDLNEAILLHREALSLRPVPYPDRSMSLNNLAYALIARFDKHGALNDLDEAISLHREALALRPVPHPDRSMSLNNLADALLARFDQQGAQHDLGEAISMHQEAPDLRSATHRGRSTSLNSLSDTTLIRYDEQDDQESALNDRDLDEAILLHREALALRPVPHPDRSISLNNLADALLTRFDQQGAPNDLDEEISLHREVLALYPTSHSRRSTSLNSLGDALLTRFEHQGTLNDLDEAVSFHREALVLCTAPHPNRLKSLNYLAITLLARFDEQGALGDLDEVISIHREMLALRAAPHQDRWKSLGNLGNALRNRFHKQGASIDLNEAISLHREAITLCEPSQPQYSSLVRDLLVNLDLQFSKDRDPEVINEVIMLYQQLLSLPEVPSSKIRSWTLENLPLALKSRYELKGDQQDLDEAADIERAGQDHNSGTQKIE